MVGVPNKQVAGGVMFKEGVKNAKYAIDKSEGESITFASQDGKAEVTIPVYYNGMASDDINIEHPTKNAMGCMDRVVGRQVVHTEQLKSYRRVVKRLYLSRLSSFPNQGA